jgi:hypothetical protein
MPKENFYALLDPIESISEAHIKNPNMQVDIFL